MTKNKLTVTWLHGPLFDAARVAGTFMEVKDQFFQHHKFLVLPYAAANTVFLPNIDYKVVLSLKHAPTYHPAEFKIEAINIIQKQLESYSVVKRVSDSEIQSHIGRIQTELEYTLQILFPHLYKHISTVTIITTLYGTEGSFDYKKEGDAYHFFIWIRTTGLSCDSIIAQLIHCLVSCFVLAANKEPDTQTQAWKQREAIVDFLLEHTRLHDVWNQTHQTLRVVESKQKSQKIVIDSQKYLENWTSILKPPVLSRKGQEFIIDTVILSNLTDKEVRLLTILFEHKNTFVNKDELFENLYGDDGGSDWSLSKLIERLRKKIEKIGITYPLLITSRKQGYKLISA